jgi:hypothetical protein
MDGLVCAYTTMLLALEVEAVRTNSNKMQGPPEGPLFMNTK